MARLEDRMQRVEPTSFYGRVEELAALGRMLDPGAVVSLIGPPGSGKSRLARHYVAGLAERYPGGVIWLELAECRSLEDVCVALANALGEDLGADSESGREATLVRRLGYAIAARGEALLVFDDLEHVADEACRALDAWREAGEVAALLVTTRQRLRLAGERCLTVAPLPVPEATEHDAERIGAFDSVKLFLDRARSVRRDALSTPEEIADVAAIVRELDGIPLAIELCAARAALLGTRQILERLAESLDLLTRGARGRGHRHATVREALDASFYLLDDGERAAFARLAVFRGGFSLDAAEHVLEPPALERLQAFVDKSLVHVFEPPGFAGELRCRLYEPMKRYAAERLDAGGERARAEDLHAAYFRESGRAWANAVDERGGIDAFRRLSLERGNLLAACEATLAAIARSAERGASVSAERALDLVLALDPVLRSTGPLRQLLGLLDAAVAWASGCGADPALLARAHIARGLARYIRGEALPSREEFDLAVADATRAGAAHLVALARAYLGVAYASQGDLAAARSELDAAAELGRAAGATRVEAIARTHRGRWVLARTGRLEEARRELDAALTMLERCSGARDQSRVHAYLGHLRFEEGAFIEAHAHYEHARRLLREFGDRRLEAELLIALAAVEQQLGRAGEAHVRLDEAREILRVIGVDAYLGVVELYAGGLALEEDRPDEAAAHFDAAAAALIAPRSSGLSAIAAAGRAISDAITGREGFDRIARARTIAADASQGIATTVELLAAAFDVVIGRDGAAVRAEAALRTAQTERPAFGEPLHDEVRVYRFARRFLGSLSRRATCARAAIAPGERAPTAWLVREDGRAFRAPTGAPVRLDRRGTLSRILRRLAAQRAAAPGGALTVYELADAGWPGERVGPESAANRVRVALTALRKLGLREILMSRDDGYLLDPAAAISIVPDLNSSA